VTCSTAGAGGARSSGASPSSGFPTPPARAGGGSLAQAPRQFRAAHARHPDVGDHRREFAASENVGATSLTHVTFADGATLDLGANTLTLTGNLDAAAGAIIGSGAVSFSGTSGTIRGTVSPVQVPGTLALAGLANATGAVSITGRLNVGADTIIVGSNLLVSGAGHLYMATAGGLVRVQGNATFAGADHNTWLTNGTLEVWGNFTQLATVHPNSFFAGGSHVTRLSGAGAQAVSFASPGGVTSHFQTLDVTNASGAGVTINSNATVAGNATQSGTLTVASPFTLTITGTLTLSAGSSTTVLGSLVKGGCVNLGAAVASGFSCP
jgi:hypothetical protein